MASISCLFLSSYFFTSIKTDHNPLTILRAVKVTANENTRDRNKLRYSKQQAYRKKCSAAFCCLRYQDEKGI